MQEQSIPSQVFENNSIKDTNKPAEIKDQHKVNNYIKICNAFWQEAPFEGGFKSAHATLFHAVLDSVNRNYWHPATLPLDYILNKCGFCRKVYTDARNWLVEKQILDVIPGRNANQMAVFKLGVAVHKWTSRDTATGTGTGAGEDTGTGTGTGTHYKTEKQEKPKTEKPKYNIEFEKFWILYDKKKGKIAAEKAWHKLTDKERETAMQHVPEYKKANVKQYRQDPKRYLLEKTFNDEIIKPSSSNKTHSAILTTTQHGERAKF